MNFSGIIMLLFCETTTIRFVCLPAFLNSAFLVSSDYRNLPEVLIGVLPIAFAELIDQMLPK